MSKEKKDRKTKKFSSKALGGAFGKMVEKGKALANDHMVENSSALEDPTSATYSPEMESLKRELLMIESKITEVTRSLKKQEAKDRASLETLPRLSASLSELRVTSHNDELGQIYDIASEFEGFRYDRGLELNYGLSDSATKLNDFMKVQVATGLKDKKRYDDQRKLLDQAFVSVENLNKSKKQSKEKQEIAQKDLEDKKMMYSLTGDNTYGNMLDVSDRHEFDNAIYVCSYMNSYFQYFKAGYMFLKEKKDEIDEIKRQANIEKSNFLNSRETRKTGVWLPEALGGSKNKVYGVDYEEVIERLDGLGQLENGIPKFLVNMIVEIEKRGLDALGIFRLSGSKSGVDGLKERINKGDLDPDVQYEDENVLAGAFKLFLRDMPTPLFVKEMYGDWMSIVDLPTDEAIQKTKECLAMLPPSNAALITRLLVLCKKIEHFSHINKMTSANLAIVLAPNVYAKGDDVLITGIEKENGLFAFLIENFSSIFPDVILEMPVLNQIVGIPPSDLPTPPPGDMPAPPPEDMPAPPPDDMPSPIPESNPPSDLPLPVSNPPDSPSPRNRPSLSSTPPSTPPSSHRPSLSSSSDIPTKIDTPQIVTLPPLCGSIDSSLDSAISSSEISENDAIELIEESSPGFMLDPSPKSYDLEHLPLATIIEILKEGKNTNAYASQIYPFYEAVNTYAYESFKGDTPSENAHNISHKFTELAGLMKKLIVVAPDYAGAMPGDLSKRLLFSVNSVKDSIRDSILLIKNISTTDVTEFKQSVVGVVTSSKRLFIESTRMSLIDGLSHAILEVSSFISQLYNTLETSNLPAIPFISNNIAHFFNKIISVLTYRSTFCTEPSKSELKQLIYECTATIDTLVQQSTMYEHNPERVKPTLQQVCQALMGYCGTILNQWRIRLDEEIASNNINFEEVYSDSHQNLIQLLDESEFISNAQSVKDLLSQIAKTSSLMGELIPTLNNVTGNNFYMDCNISITKSIGNIRDQIISIESSLEPNSVVKVTLSKYHNHLAQLKSSIELASIARYLSVSFDAYQHVNELFFLGEFSYLTRSLISTVADAFI